MEALGTSDDQMPNVEENAVLVGSGVAMQPYNDEDVSQSMTNPQPDGDNGDHLSKAEKWIKTVGAFGTFIGYVSSVNFH